MLRRRRGDRIATSQRNKNLLATAALGQSRRLAGIAGTAALPQRPDRSVDDVRFRVGLIDDVVRDLPRSRVFDPLKHCLNPLKDISYKRAREIADIVYTAYPQGENTLTVRNGKRGLLSELLKVTTWESKMPDRFDKIKGDEEVSKTIQDLLMSPVLRRVLCNPTNFSFNPNSVIQVRINRAELGDFDALVLGLLLMSLLQGPGGRAGYRFLRS